MTSPADDTQPTPNDDLPSQESLNDLMIDFNDNDFVTQVAGVYQVWCGWAYFELSVTSPSMESFEEPMLILPEVIDSSGQLEFVYPIWDYGNKMSTSKAEDMVSSGLSMCKLHYTIEKIIYLLIERLKDSGTTGDTEVLVTFEGHQSAQRKAFESIINLEQNVVVTNFNPDAWGDNYLDTVKRMVERGYGYPAESPRRSVYHSAKGGPKSDNKLSR